MAGKIILIISTSFPEANFLGLADSNFNFIKKKKFRAQTSDNFFYVWRKFIKRSDFEKISGIIVHQGSGSFSGLRLSAIIGNTLKIAYPSIKLFEIRANTLEEFLKKAERGEAKVVFNFIKPSYPKPPSIS